MKGEFWAVGYNRGHLRDCLSQSDSAPKVSKAKQVSGTFPMSCVQVWTQNREVPKVQTKSGTSVTVENDYYIAQSSNT